MNGQKNKQTDIKKEHEMDLTRKISEMITKIKNLELDIAVITNTKIKEQGH